MAKPVVDGIEKALNGRGTVIRIPLTGEIGRAVVAEWGIRAVPTLLVYDGDGNEILRQVGGIRKDAVMAALGLPSRPWRGMVIHHAYLRVRMYRVWDPF